MDYRKIFMNVKEDTIEETIVSLCRVLVEKKFTFRQAECLLDLAKDRLKDAKL